MKRLEDELTCPTEREAKFELFPLTCNKNHDCAQTLGSNFRCCKLFGGQRCHEGLEIPLEDIEHERKFEFSILINRLSIFPINPQPYLASQESVQKNL